jgi:hypothetical protein
MRRLVILVTALLLVLSSCENLFTTSPFAFLQRDPSTLSDAQKQQFALDALASGDEETMAAAYEALKDTTDPATQLLAADLALGASGLEGAVTETVAALSGGADVTTTLDETLAGFSAEDLTRFQEAADLVNAADDSVQPTAEQYAFAAIGMLAVAAEAAGGVGSVDPSDPGQPAAAEAEALIQASYDTLQASGESTDLLVSLGESIGMTF